MANHVLTNCEVNAQCDDVKLEIWKGSKLVNEQGFQLEVAWLVQPAWPTEMV